MKLPLFCRIWSILFELRKNNNRFLLDWKCNAGHTYFSWYVNHYWEFDCNKQCDFVCCFFSAFFPNHKIRRKETNYFWDKFHGHETFFSLFIRCFVSWNQEEEKKTIILFSVYFFNEILLLPQKFRCCFSNHIFTSKSFEQQENINSPLIV